jgi:uncharacterized protein (TIGR02001 family)
MAATALVGGVVLSAPAFAQDEAASEFEVSGNAAIVTEYRFRGVDLSGGDPAIQGGIDVSHSSGFYVGTWGSSLDEDTVGFGHTELDVYGGWTGDLTDGVALDVGAIAYLYPNAGPGDFDYFEGYASLGFTLGPVESSIGVAYAPEQDSLGGQDNLYLFTDIGLGIPGTPVSINGHLGYTDGFLTYTTDGQAFDWSLGADFAINDLLSVGVAYVEAEGGPLTPGAYNFVDDTVVGTLSASF